MKYMGSKSRIAKHILPIILKDRKDGQFYVEPFVGGANMIDKVDGNRIGSDNNKYLIACLDALKYNTNWLPLSLTESEYKNIRNNKEHFPPELVGYVGFALSYGGKWFGGYRRDSEGKRDYIAEAYRSAVKQSIKIKGIEFIHTSYLFLKIPDNSIIYCDPPYSNSTKYNQYFDHQIFWQWCRDVSIEGHSVFVSEYNAPDDFKCIWEKEIASSLTKNTGSKSGTERLYVYNN